MLIGFTCIVSCSTVTYHCSLNFLKAIFSSYLHVMKGRGKYGHQKCSMCLTVSYTVRTIGPTMVGCREHVSETKVLRRLKMVFEISSS